MILRARVLKFKQFPAETDPLRPKHKYKRRSDIEAAFDRMERKEAAQDSIQTPAEDIK